MYRLASLVVVVFVLVSAPPSSAAFPGANGRIALMRANQVYTVRADGTGLTKLTSTGRNARPSWSPDGTRIAFQRCCRRGKWTQVWVMNANGGGQTNLSRSNTNDSAPSFYPDGRIVFVRNGAIWRMNADGSGKQRVKAPPAGFSDDRPKVSPDGTKILFQRCCWAIPGGPPEGGAQVFAMNADGTAVTNLSRTAGVTGDYWPDWSPTGTRVVFIRADLIHPDSMFAMDVSGANQAQVSTINAAAPVYSPDGTMIAFESYPSQGRIDRIPAGGGPATPITAGFQPSWQPVT
ncbi:MAG TPA: hypothetical protein VE824_05115 [Gaiellales bacterium]|nr:hypothetical protein [Gaiellales bacterium]